MLIVNFLYLFSFLEIWGKCLKNCIMLSGYDMLMFIDNLVNELFVVYYCVWVCGGVGLIVMQVVGVYDSVCYILYVLMVIDDVCIFGYWWVVEVCYVEGCVVLLQIFYFGCEIMEFVDGLLVVVYFVLVLFNEWFWVMLCEFDQLLIDEIVVGYVVVVCCLYQVGLDGVEVVVSYGYLLV